MIQKKRSSRSHSRGGDEKHIDATARSRDSSVAAFGHSALVSARRRRSTSLSPTACALRARRGLHQCQRLHTRAHRAQRRSLSVRMRSRACRGRSLRLLSLCDFLPNGQGDDNVTAPHAARSRSARHAVAPARTVTQSEVSCVHRHATGSGNFGFVIDRRSRLESDHLASFSTVHVKCRAWLRASA